MSEPRPSRSLTTRVLVGLAVATGVPTVVVGLLAIRHAFNDVEREVVRGNLALIRSLGATLDARLQDTRRAVETAAAWWAYERESPPAGGPAPGSGDPPGVFDTMSGPAVSADAPAPPPGALAVPTADPTSLLLDRIKHDLPFVSTLSIVAPDGRLLHGDPVPATVDLGRLTYGGYISDILYEDGQPRIRVVIQARSRTGELVGAFIAGINLDFVAEALQALVAESRLGTGAELLVVDGEGRPIARSAGTTATAGAPGDPQRSLRETDPAVALALGSATEGSHEDDHTISVYRSIASYQSQRGVRWAIILEQPTEHAYALAHKTMRDTIITGVAVLTLSLVIGMFLAARLTRPLHQLAERADAIAGEGAAGGGETAPIDAPGEIGLLAQRIEEMARRLREREQLQSALARGDRLATVGTMAASVAHEINNPLTTVLGYANLLAEDKPGDHPDRPGLELIAEEAGRMKAIVGNLLSYSRGERAPRRGHGHADVNATLRHTADLLVPQLSRSHVQVAMELAADLPACAVDTHSLQQVFVNLVQNGAQAMPGGGTVTIRSRRAAHDHTVEVSIIDQGPGVPAADRPRVFDPFFTTKEAGAGTGLGLTVCKHLIVSAGGSIEVVDGPDGRGACFRIAIPVAGTAPRATAA